MKKFILTFCLCFLLTSVAFAGEFEGLKPGVSKKADADRTLGSPIKEVVKGVIYDYNPNLHDASRISIKFNRDSQLIEAIDLYFKTKYDKSQFITWFELHDPMKTMMDAKGNLVEYYFPQKVSLHYEGPTVSHPIQFFSHFDPTLLQKEIIREWTVTPERKMEASKKIPEKIEPSRPGDVALVLLEDTFESENGQKGALNYTGFENWDVIQGSVDLIGRGFWDHFPDHGLHVDMDGTTRQAGTLSSKRIFRLEPRSYRLEFDLAGNPFSGPNTVTVRLGRIYNEAFTLNQKEPFRTITRQISVSVMEEAKLVFQHAGGDNDGLFLDNIRLARLTSQSTVTPRGYDQAMGKSPTELVIGKWRWFNGLIVEITGGGMVAKDSRGNMVDSGSWRVLDVSKRKFEMRWGSGNWIDTLTLSNDNNSLEGTNQINGHVSAKRITK